MFVVGPKKLLCFTNGSKEKPLVSSTMEGVNMNKRVLGV